MLNCSLEQAVDQVLQRIDGPIRLGLPLGLGKPVGFVNALYQRIKQQPQRSLIIYTALSLGRPHASSDLEQRLLGPFLERVYADCPELDYLHDLRRGTLPSNIQLEEFYLQPGSLLGNPAAQQAYVSLNYSQVARDLDRKGVNLVAHLLASDPRWPQRLSLSCNPDITLDLLPLLAARREAGETILCVAQCHADLPFMPGDAEVAQDSFDLLIDEVERHRLFSTPAMPVSLQDHCIGLHASSLVRDGGTLQIGIGAMSDALAAAVRARHANNGAYRALLASLQVPQRWPALIDAEGGLAPFVAGLYGCSEMLVPGLLSLLDAGVLRRAVYADERLQRLANVGALDEQGRLHDLGAGARELLPARLDAETLAWLQATGLLAAEIQLQGGALRLPDGQSIAADLDHPHGIVVLQPYLGSAQGGVLVHGGFFLGPLAFYQRLQQLTPVQRGRIGMTGIGFINRLYGQETLKRLQRRDARFINSAFSVTLLGAGVADQLEDGRVISGVGGQYDFFAQAHELAGARAILMLRSWREQGGEVSSNILWQYGHSTIPRHLRDIVVTEYGIADLRGKSDAAVVEALLQIADSRFQDQLIEQAQQAGKLSPDFVLAPAWRQNTPEHLARACAGHLGLVGEYPLGCDFTEVEQDLLRALRWLKSKLRLSELLELGKAALLHLPEPATYAEHLARMGLAQPDGVREQLYQKLLLIALGATPSGGGTLA
ncbi:MAG: acetyl-CoA hydrolase/transferase C-terminal domain-containing protein [Pseudomonas sp.]|uniref:acetyl-CoA hydrolase/transferase C-terminal domain-containing protein n=1 Tax=Pseudomonas sp. TaxID=306 RepID=UPI003398BC35